MSGGLANLGLTCGINTLIQCISHTSRLHAIISKQNNKDNKLTHQLADVINKISIEKVSLNPGGLVQEIYNSFKGRIGEFEQHDVSELWMLISDRIEEEIGVKYDEPESEVKKIVHKLNNGKISDWTKSVQGITKTTIYCNECNNSNINYETFNVLSLDLCENITTINELIGKLSIIEKLEDYKCDKCKHISCYKKTEIFKLPKVLVLVLKRFKMTERGFERKNIGVHIPLELHSDKTYKLTAMGNHFGHYNGGHYTALCNHENKWIHYDDLTRGEIENTSQFINNNVSAYILFYEQL